MRVARRCEIALNQPGLRVVEQKTRKGRLRWYQGDERRCDYATRGVFRVAFSSHALPSQLLAAAVSPLYGVVDGVSSMEDHSVERMILIKLAFEELAQNTS